MIVPVRNDPEGLARCLDGLLGQRAGWSFEVIVVDNGSSDATPDRAAAHPVRPRVLTELRRGSYAARNAGILAARAPLLAFTDADCVPSPQWLEQGVIALQDGEVAGGRIDTRLRRPTSIWEQWDGAHYLNQEAYVAEGFAATANLFMRTEALDAVGPFDPSLLSSGDLEWGLRATAAGLRLGYAPEAVVAHRVRGTARETWQLHRRLGAGWRALAARGLRPRAWRDPYLRPRFGEVLAAARARGFPVRAHRLLVAHILVVSARWHGRLTGR